jgi:hypothetical protein
MVRLSLKSRLNYPRYTAPLLRPRGSGAFFDFVAEVARTEVAKLETCSIRRFGLRVVARR